MTRDSLPMLWAMVAANRASARLALAGESDNLDMAESAAEEFNQLAEIFDGTDYEAYRRAASEQAQRAVELAGQLQV
ncbi:MAG: hypothetical protein M5U09_02620 [Gammaproteobacteria bacterium]|nr:hypothetical protein [Gammaproteobacteria bacterium]